jgi:hypothetical protein
MVGFRSVASRIRLQKRNDFGVAFDALIDVDVPIARARDSSATNLRAESLCLP